VNFNKHKLIVEIIKIHKYWYSNWHKRKADKVLNRDRVAS